MMGYRDRNFAYAKMAHRQHRAHRPGQCRRLWKVDIDAAVATHREGWTLHRFPAASPEVAIDDFRFKLSLLSDQETAEFVERGLAVLNALGL